MNVVAPSRLSVERLCGADAAPALALRRAVFEGEMGAEADADAFDARAEHLVLRDPGQGGAPVVGTLRMLMGAAYTEREFDLTPLHVDPRPLAEIGRVCLAPAQRGGSAGLLLLSAALQRLAERGVGLVVGTGSFPGADAALHMPALRALRDAALAPSALRPRPRGPEAIAVEGAGDPRDMRAVPPLLKTYLRAGAMVGDGAWCDRAFDTVDVCLVLEMDRLRLPGTRRA